MTLLLHFVFPIWIFGRTLCTLPNPLVYMHLQYSSATTLLIYLVFDPLIFRAPVCPSHSHAFGASYAPILPIPDGSILLQTGQILCQVEHSPSPWTDSLFAFLNLPYLLFLWLVGGNFSLTFYFCTEASIYIVRDIVTWVWTDYLGLFPALP